MAAERESQSWERLDDEPGRWFQQFERYRLLGPDRSVLGAFNLWRVEKGREKARGAPDGWHSAFRLYRWQERAEAWDKHCSDQVGAVAEAERVRILSSGYALPHERVRDLDQVARFLFSEIFDEDSEGRRTNVWLPDVKQIGGGEFAERVDIVRFNAAVFEQYRGALEDLAAEMGERVKGIDVTSKGRAVPVIAIEVIQPPATQPASRPADTPAPPAPPALCPKGSGARVAGGARATECDKP